MIRSQSACCRRCGHQILLQRATSLRQAADSESEETLLKAAVWLRERARSGMDPKLFLEVALHYLLLQEHPEVRTQPGLPARYLHEADTWLARAAPLDSSELPDRRLAS